MLLFRIIILTLNLKSKNTLKNASLYHITGLNHRFIAPQSGLFADYISQYRDIISKARQQTHFYADTLSIDRICPFEQGAGRQGILLLHGLMETPFMMSDIAQYFSQRNYLTRALLLPGHGTVPGDLLNIKSRAWFDCYDYGIQSMTNNDAIDEFYIIGTSTGAILALLSVYKHMTISKLKGIILISPALRVQTYHGWYINLSNCLKKFWPRAAWINRVTENDFARYYSLPFNAAHQVYMLTQLFKRQYARQALSIPMFIAVSADDRVICPDTCLKFFEQQKHPQSRMLIYGNPSSSSHDQRVEIAPSGYPEQNILHFSHISLQISPDNFHYGQFGNYEQKLRNDQKEKIYGEIKHPLKPSYRLSYNPDFYHFMDRLNTFIGGI
ncbi:MAG: alpha/beta hydrolase [Pseudomonadota bacterium]